MALRSFSGVAAAAAAVLLLAGGPAVAQGAPGASAALPAGTGKTMTNQEKKQLITEYLEATARLDFDRMGSYLTDDFTIWFVPSARQQGLPIPLNGRQAFMDFVRKLQDRPGKWRIRSSTPLQIFYSDDGAAVRVRNIGEFPGGGVYDNEYVFLYRFKDGKISEMREFTDTAYIGMLSRKAAEQAQGKK